jgi:hypothetical protein
MKRTLFACAIILSACGYDGHYRYDCQDPENWEAEECNPPVCLVDGTCTEFLLGFDPDSPDSQTVPTTSTTAPTQEGIAP